MVVFTLLTLQVVVITMPVHVLEPSAPVACATVLWATIVPIRPIPRTVVQVVLQPKLPVVQPQLIHRVTPVAVVISEVVASAVAVPVLQVEAVASVVAVEAVLLVAMQVDADNMNSEQLIVNSDK